MPHDSHMLPDIRRRGQNLARAFTIFRDFESGWYGKDLALANESDPTGTFSAVADRGEWLVTLIDGDTDALETIGPLDDAHGGILRLLNNDADNDAISIQMNGESVALAANRRIIYQARVRITDVSASDWAFGLAVADTDILGGVTDSIMFRCPDATGDIDYVVEKDSTESTADTGHDVSDATFRVFKFEVNGTTDVRFWVDDNAPVTVNTNLPDNEAMSPFFTLRNSGAAAQSMDIDYVLVVASR